MVAFWSLLVPAVCNDENVMTRRFCIPDVSIW